MGCSASAVASNAEEKKDNLGLSLEEKADPLAATCSSSIFQTTRPFINVKASPAALGISPSIHIGQLERQSSNSGSSPDFPKNKYHSPNIRASYASAKFKDTGFDQSLIDLFDVLSEEYELIELLGTGASASVYKVKCKRTGEVRALKRLHPNFCSKIRMEREQNLLIREGHILSDLSHPNLIRGIELLDVSNEIILLMEYCEGGRLMDALKSAKSLISEEVVARLIGELLNVVAYLHERNIVHRDIKIENILLEDSDLTTSSLKLIDLGIAVEMDGRTSLTSVAGTSCYMAPELLLGNYGEKVDEWACGVIMYILITGTMPFKGTNFEETKQDILTKTLNFDHPLLIRKSPECIAMIKGLLEYDPEKRLSAAEAVKMDWIQKNKNLNPANFVRIKSCIVEGLQQENKKVKVLLNTLMIKALCPQRNDRKDATDIFNSLVKSNKGQLMLDELVLGFIMKGLCEKKIRLKDLQMGVNSQTEIAKFNLRMLLDIVCKIVMGDNIKLKGMLFGYVDSLKISQDVSQNLELALVEALKIKPEVLRTALSKDINKLDLESFYHIQQQIFV